jgi:hypothetical protein
MDDGSLMPRAYGAWKQNAKAALRTLHADAGADLVEKVEIEPAEFQAWCQANGLGLNAFSRTKYVSEIATKLARAH